MANLQNFGLEFDWDIQDDTFRDIKRSDGSQLEPEDWYALQQPLNLTFPD